MKIWIIPIIFSAGFVAGTCWRAMLRSRLAYVAFISLTIVLTIFVFFENLPALVHNLFHRTKKKIYWDLSGLGGECRE